MPELCWKCSRKEPKAEKPLLGPRKSLALGIGAREIDRHNVREEPLAGCLWEGLLSPGIPGYVRVKIDLYLSQYA